MPTISIIVPVYNTGELIKPCLESLMNQNFQDYEVLIINDGSTDISEEIILGIIRGKSNYQYFYQDNQGLSAARNSGLYHAKGEYIAFVDSDDWVEFGFLQSMIDGIIKYEGDVCECGYERKIGSETLSSVLPANRVTELTNENDLISLYFRTCIEQKYGIICCNKLYKRKVIDEACLRFEKNNEIYAEDLLFNTKFLLYAKRIVEIPESLYNYRIREGSITRAPKPELEKRYSELLRRVEPIIKKRLPHRYNDLIALMEYEIINVITMNIFLQVSPKYMSVYSSLITYEDEGGKIYRRLKHLNTAMSGLIFNKKEMRIFLWMLSVSSRLNRYFILGILFWLKHKVANSIMRNPITIL